MKLRQMNKGFSWLFVLDSAGELRRGGVAAAGRQCRS